MSVYPQYTDEQLLGLLRNGDPSSFAEIYNRYNKALYRYVITLVKIPQVAEDLVHEVFVKIWESKEKLDVTEYFRGYIFRMCRNKVADMTRRAVRERHFRDQLQHSYLFNLSGDEQHSREELLRYDNLVEEALDSLSPQRRKVFELCRKEGRSHAEVAAELQISPNTVKEHMSKALSSLRDFLRERGEFTLIVLLFEKIIK